MKLGKLPEHNLTNGVVNILAQGSYATKSTSDHAGKDCYDFSRQGNSIYTEGVGSSPEVAWAKAINNFHCSGGICDCARITMLLCPDTKEKDIKNYMSAFSKLSADTNIQILGGHTEIYDSKNNTFIVNMFGHAGIWEPNKLSITENSSVIMVGYTGILGTNELISSNKSAIDNYFGNHFSKGYVFKTEEYNSFFYDHNDNFMSSIHYMHDISSSGVYGALWELGSILDKGLEIYNESIPIKQETIEICECLDINPYLIDGTGGMLLVCDNPEPAVRILSSMGLVANCIGKISNRKEKVVYFTEDEYRTLSPS